MAISLPRYFSSDVELWFIQADACFSEAHTQKQKYQALLAALPSEALQKVKDTLRTAASDPEPYTLLKQALLSCMTVSEEDRITQLLAGESLGDRTPSDMLAHMLDLLGAVPSGREETIVRHLFMQKMPAEVQPILAACRVDITLKHLAETADRIIRVQVPRVSAVASPQSDLESRVSRLERKLEELTVEVRGLALRNRSATPKSRTRTSASRTRSRSRGRPGECYYHQAFGDQARKCTKPCSFQENK